MKIQSIDKEMREVLSSYFYRIPTFQRPYSWEVENVDEFWNDILSEDVTNYFIGSMVVFKVSNGIYGIVDGQQRLTTITMLLCALRNSFREEGASNLADALQQYVERVDVNANKQFILQTETSYPYFQEYIQKSTPPDLDPTIGQEEKNLNTAFKRITNHIKQSIQDVRKEHYGEDRIKQLINDNLVNIRDRILNLKVISIDLTNEEDAYIAFETLNTRGKDLEVSDLVKSYIVRLLRPQNLNIDTAKERWNEIVNNIESTNEKMRDFLHDYWVSKHNYVSVKNLYKAVKDQVKDENANEFLNDLLESSRIYRHIVAPDTKKWKKEDVGIRSSLEALRVFRVKQHLPVLLVIMSEYSKGTLKKKKVEHILRVIESFHFIFTAVVSERANKARKEFFAKYGRDLVAAAENEPKLKTLTDFQGGLQEKLPTFADFELNFARISLTTDDEKQKSLVQYILAEIDKHHQHNSGIAIDYKQMTIEHIAPQNPSDGVECQRVGEIGNLILTEGIFNSSTLGNKSFADKKRLLLESKVWVDESIKNSTDWGDVEIEKRTKQLAKLAYDIIWHI